MYMYINVVGIYTVSFSHLATESIMEGTSVQGNYVYDDGAYGKDKHSPNKRNHQQGI